MKAEPHLIEVHRLLERKKKGHIKVNAEYQRGVVWSESQKKKLVDSVLRGYPIPLLYLHRVSNQDGDDGLGGVWQEVIDGQQRLNALEEFWRDGFALFDPIQDDKHARFPAFIKKTPCAWGRKTFSQLDAEDKARLLNTQLHVVEITTNTPNEARDLFIRLQAGLPLNGQEKRDAWPGNLPDFVLRLGGKNGLVGKSGHDFFKKFIVKTGVDRGKGRQLCAQLLSLFIHRREQKGGQWPDINSRALDEFYYKNLDFDPNSPWAVEFQKVLDRVAELFATAKKVKPLKGHEAIGVMLLVDALMNEYSRGWEDHFVSKFAEFRTKVLEDKKTRESSDPGIFWTQYDSLTRTNSDRGQTIQTRHAFFAKQMCDALKDQMKFKDPTRIFGEVERELIFYRQKSKCFVCGGAVAWDQHQIHHVDPHSQGGPTTVTNGVMVHVECHPKAAAAVAAAKNKHSGMSETGDDIHEG